MWGYNSYYSQDFYGMGLFKFLIPMVLIDLILRGFALWKSARKDQNVWFIALLVINSMGILPLIYLLLNKDQKESSNKKSKSK